MKKFYLLCIMFLPMVYLTGTEPGEIFFGDTVLHYSFERMVDNKVEDFSGNNFTGSVYHGDIVEGYVGKALDIYESDSGRVWVGIDDKLDVDYFTIMVWVYPYSLGSDSKRMEILEKTNVFWVNIRNGNEPDRISERGHVRGGIFGWEEPDTIDNPDGRQKVDGNWRYLDSKDTVSLNEWTHVAFTYDGSKFAMYLNGVLNSFCYECGPKFEDPMMPYISKNDKPLIVGQKLNVNEDGSYGDYVAQFDGRIDELFILDYAVEEQFVNEYYTEQSSLHSTGKDYRFTGQPDHLAFILYPNPADDLVNISLSSGMTDSPDLYIYNIMGKLCYSQKFTGNLSLSASRIGGKGVYFVKLVYPGSREGNTQKLIIR